MLFLKFNELGTISLAKPPMRVIVSVSDFVAFSDLVLSMRACILCKGESESKVSGVHCSVGTANISRFTWFRCRFANLGHYDFPHSSIDLAVCCCPCIPGSFSEERASESLASNCALIPDYLRISLERNYCDAGNGCIQQ